MKAWLRTRARDERGQVAGAEMLPFGFLVFIVGALIVANAWGVIDSKMAAESAAREAARAYVEAPPGTKNPFALAEKAAEQAIEGYGRDPRSMDIPPVRRESFRRCQRVTFTVRYTVPMFTVPWVGALGDGLTAVGRHSEIVDPYRSGLAGKAECAR